MQRLRCLPTLALVFVVTSVIPAKAQISSEEAAYRKLVLRLVSPTSQAVQLLPGRLPERLPVDLPLPDGASVVGSVVRSQENFQVLLDVTASPEQVRDFYVKRLETTGWQERRSFQFKGFLPSDVGPINVLALCKGSIGPFLSILTKPTQNGPTDVRLDLNTKSTGSVCQQPQAQPFSFEAPLPSLVAPPNTQIRPISSSSGDKSYETRAILETELSSQALVTHYSAQLQQAGWTRTNGGQSGPMVWSLWTLKNKQGVPYQGMFSLLKIAGERNQYLTSVLVLQP